MAPGVGWVAELLENIMVSPLPPQGRQPAQEGEEHGRGGDDCHKASVTGECELSVACNEQACISLLYTLSDVRYLLVLHEHVHHRLLEPLKVGVVGKCCFRAARCLALSPHQKLIARAKRTILPATGGVWLVAQRIWGWAPPTWLKQLF